MTPPSQLSAAYRRDGSGRDFNLNLNRWDELRTQFNIPWLVEWQQHCELEAGRALEFVSSHASLRRQQERGQSSLRRQHTKRIAQLESRLTRLTGTALVEERELLDDEQMVYGLLNDAIGAPEIRADAVGAIFMSARTPFRR